MRVRTPITVLSTLCLAAAVGAGPAAAAVIASGQDTIDDTFSVGTCEGPDGTVYDMTQHDVGSARWADKFRGPAASFSYDQVWFGGERGKVTSTYLNATTGRSWTGVSHWLNKDQRLLGVDGNLQTYLRVNVSHSVIYAPDGSVAGRSEGRVAYTVTIDTKGTPSLDDDSEEFGEVVSESGLRTIGDFCADALRFTVA